MRIRNIFLSEVYKICRSPILLFHILIPLLGAMIFLSYYSIAGWNEQEKILGYLQVVAGVFPIVIAMCETMLVQQEVRAGKYDMLLTVPHRRASVHFVKLTIVSVLGLCATLLSMFGFGILFRKMGNIGLPTLFYGKVAILLFTSYIPLYMIQYVICYIGGKGIGLGVGILGSLLTLLLRTGLGDECWMYFPWGIPIHLSCRYAYEEMLQINLWSNPEVKIAWGWLMILVIIMIVFIIIWSKKWEPHVECDEE